MNNEEIEARLRNAISDVTPDEFANIEKKLKKEDYSMSKKISKLVGMAVAACFVVCVGIGGYAYYDNNFRPDSIVDIDVNPSIEVLVNKHSKVIETKALNSDAEKVLEGMELRNLDIKVATNAIVGSIVKNGYMKSEDAGVLVTVINNDSKRAEELKEKVAADIKTTLEENKVDAKIIKQIVVETEELKTIASKNKVSVGKAALVKDLAKKGSEEDVNDAAKKPIKDLMKEVLKDAKLTEVPGNAEFEADDGKYEISFTKGNKEYEYEIDTKTGEIVSKEVEDKEGKNEDVKGVPMAIKITEDEAKAIALKDANVTKVKDFKIELDHEKYEIEFITTDGTEYSYDIGGSNGKILSKEIKQEKAKKVEENKEEVKKEQPKKEAEKDDEDEDEKETSAIVKITEEEAKAIALKDAKVEATKIKAELDDEKYEVGFKTEDGKEYSYEISVTDGKILAKEAKEKDVDEDEKDVKEDKKDVDEDEKDVDEDEKDVKEDKKDIDEDEKDVDEGEEDDD